MLGNISVRSRSKVKGNDSLFQVSGSKLPDWKVDIMGKPLGPR